MIIDRVTGEVIEAIPFPREQRCVRYRVTCDPVGDSMTHQSHLDSVDVNNIVKRYERSGIPLSAAERPVYGDVTGLQGDLTERYNQAKETLSTARSFVDEQSAKAKAAQAAQAAPGAPGGVPGMAGTPPVPAGGVPPAPGAGAPV